MKHLSRLPVCRPTVAFLFLLAVGLPARSAEICEAKLDCIINACSDTLVLPEKAVMISKEVGHCSPTLFIEDFRPGHTDTISVFIIIDHSGSMSYMDSTGSRYRMARDLIDSIYAHSPASEVGIAIFSNQLLYNYQQDPVFVQLDPASGWLDSYFPLTRLDTQVGGVSAVTRLKQALALSTTQKDIGGNWQLLQGYYGAVGRTPFTPAAPPGYNGTTDISLAFEAAKKAFLSARYAAERQFVVFLSDGVHQNVDIERQPHDTDYVLGVGMPTTFTAFWINQGQPIPQPMVRMTNNIKANGYSTRNSASQIWWNPGTSTEFFTSMLQVFVGSGSYIVNTHPVSLTIGGVTTTSFDSTWAYFNAGFPLTGAVTSFPVSFTFHCEAPKNSDSTYTMSLVVKRLGTTTPTGVTLSCWEQGYLQIFYQNTPVTVVEANMTSLEARFYPSAANPVSKATIWITNASGSDTVVLTAANYLNYFGAGFAREYGTPSIDDILQNGMNDSIIAIYRNPDLPLDVVRTSVRVLPPRDMEVKRAYYLDQGSGMANGYPDVIRVELGDTLFADEVNIIQSYIRLNTTRGVTVRSIQPNGRGFDIILNEPTSGDPNTALLPGENIHIDSIPNLPRGGWFPTANAAIQDSMGPVIVRASYLDLSDPLAFDTLRVVFSEPMKTVGASEPFNFNRGIDISDYSLRVTLVSQSGASAVFGIVPLTGQVEPLFGDSIWIDATANVTDSVNVRQKTVNNVKRLLDFSSLLRIVSAVYIDENADGFPDIVRVTMDQPADSLMLNALASTIGLPAYRDFRFTRTGLSTTAAGFDIHVTQGGNATRNTAVDNRDSLKITAETKSASGDLIRQSAVPITDGMAPVIVKATYMPAVVVDENNVPPDTLVVVFSEKMPHIASGHPFLLTSAVDGQEYYFEVTPLSGEGTATQTFLVHSVSGQESAVDRDIIRIAPDQNVADMGGIVQDDPNNNGVPLDVRPFRMHFTIKVSPNPSDPSSAPIPPAIADIVRNSTGTTVSNGIVIVAKPKATVAGAVVLTGRASMYDAVGNAVFLNEKGIFDNGRKRIYIVWDGTNRQGRRVGSGAYLAMVTIRDESTGSEETQQLKVGVKR